MKLKVILILTLCLIISTVACAARKKAKPTCGATSFNDCPTEGCGGDPLLNEKKNRVDQPEPSDVEKVTRTRFAKLKFPAKWKSGAKRDLLETWGEGTAVEYEAYLIKITLSQHRKLARCLTRTGLL